MKNTHKPAMRSTTFSLSLASLGIVFGDVGTSPLYAMQVSLYGLSITMIDVLGVLSLIFWTLIFVISIKYAIILFRADNHGEGGILALLALLNRSTSKHRFLLLILSIFGAGLMLGDGMLTPAISVISAIEGINVIFPAFSSWIIPLTTVILIGLFSVQSFGTEKIGRYFGPVILVWFITIGVLGLNQIIHHPEVMKAINPYYAYAFFKEHGWRAYALLGGIFLVVTGAEALYADLGHFGKRPIQISWFFIALPGLILSYFGQGAHLLSNPGAIENPFYMLAPTWFAIPLLILSTLATIIASQAVISATFSLTRQAVLLGLYPHLSIIQTSDKQVGQIYVPQMNLILAIGTLVLVYAFKNANGLTHAYGVGVNLVMVLTSLLIFYLAMKKWNWSYFVTITLFSFMCLIDFIFLGSNIQKMLTGGWVPTSFAVLCATIMYTWNCGIQYLHDNYIMKKDKLLKTITQLEGMTLTRLPDTTAIFIPDIYDKHGGSFLNFLKLNKTLPENILIINYTVKNYPHVALKNRFKCVVLTKNIIELTLCYGFMDMIAIPEALLQANRRGILPFSIDVDTTTYLLEIPTVVASHKKKSLRFFWQEKLFSFLIRNYSVNINIEFYQLPFDRTVAIGTYYVI